MFQFTHVNITLSRDIRMTSVLVVSISINFEHQKLLVLGFVLGVSGSLSTLAVDYEHHRNLVAIFVTS